MFNHERNYTTKKLKNSLKISKLIKIFYLKNSSKRTFEIKKAPNKSEQKGESKRKNASFLFKYKSLNQVSYKRLKEYDKDC